MYELNQSALNPNDLWGVNSSGVRIIPGLGCGMGCMGLGQDGGGLFGTGLFESSDFSTWGIGEYAVIALGLFAVLSMFSTGKRAASSVSKKVRKISRIPAQRRQARAAKPRAEAAQLEVA